MEAVEAPESRLEMLVNKQYRIQLDSLADLLFVYHVYCLFFASALLILYYRMEKRCGSKDVMRQYYWEVLVERCSSQDENGSSELSCFES